MIETIDDIYKDYFQKSKIFLYPLLGIKKSSITPISTFMEWLGTYSIKDNKLMCLYHLRNDGEFINYEENFLFKNKRFIDYHEVSGNRGLYIFDFDDLKNDFRYIVHGKYSEISNQTKLIIKNYYGKNSANYVLLDSYLYPERYHEMYAGFLNVQPQHYNEMLSIIKEVNELCSRPNYDKELLEISVIKADSVKNL